MNLFCVQDQSSIIKDKVQKKFDKIISSGSFILGNNVKALEQKLANFTKSNYCISVSSGTDALLISLMALNIKKNDEIITTAFTYVATVEVILRLGAKPILVDINKKTGLIDENEIKKNINKNTKAIIAVSLFGNLPDFSNIKKISPNIKIIEDAAQSFGSKLNNKYSCNLSDIGCTSFYPTKNLSCFGDGGAIFTNSKKLANKMMIIRVHGEKKKYNSEFLGVCGRLDEMQAAVLLEKFKIFKSELKQRISIGNKINKIVRSSLVSLDNSQIAYNTFPILVKNREELVKIFEKNKIQYGIYYPIPIHRQKFFPKKYYKQLPITDFFSKHILSLPVNPYINNKKYLSLISKILNDYRYTPA